MPIRPENKARYPKDWKQIVVRIRDRSGDRCECLGECGSGLEEHGGRCPAKNGLPHPLTKSKVVLTVAHLDHMPENCGDENLRHMCQRCHNRYDMPERRRGIKERARQGRAEGDLFDDGPKLQTEMVDATMAYLAERHAVADHSPKLWVGCKRQDVVRLQIAPAIIAAQHAHESIARVHIESPPLDSDRTPLAISFSRTAIDITVRIRSTFCDSAIGSADLRSNLWRSWHSLIRSRLAFSGNAHRCLSGSGMLAALEFAATALRVFPFLNSSARETFRGFFITPRSITTKLTTSFPSLAFGALLIAAYASIKKFVERQTAIFSCYLCRTDGCLCHALRTIRINQWQSKAVVLEFLQGLPL